MFKVTLSETPKITLNNATISYDQKNPYHLQIGHTRRPIPVRPQLRSCPTSSLVVKSAVIRDVKSGDGVDFLTITKNGIEEECIKF